MAIRTTGTDQVEPSARSTTDQVPVQRLGRLSVAWRVALLLIGTVLIIRGSVIGEDDDWPFGPMSQFAFRVGHNDSIRATFLEARTVDGDDIMVPITTNDLGLGRAEIEGQQGRFIRDPASLQILAAAYHRIHPTKPALQQLWLREKVTVLHDGRKDGVHIVTLSGWPDNDH